MVLLVCYECSNDVSSSAAACPKCGAVFLGSALPPTGLGLKPNVVCKFCNTAGQVWVTLAERKRGVSGGKATGAILTGGLSLFLTGLSRNETVSRLNCKNCGMNWDE